MKSVMKASSFLLVLVLLSCGNKALYHTELHGFEGNKLRMKYIASLEKVSLDNGKPGLLMTIETKYSEGASKRRNSLNRVWMNEDYTFVRQEKEVIRGDKTSTYKAVLDGNEMIVTDNLTGKDREERVKLKMKSPIMGELHPLMFAKDMPSVGNQKVYTVFYEPIRVEVPIRVKCQERITINQDGKSYECLRYAMQSVGRPGKYDDYYITVDDHQLVQINIADLEFRQP